ncbi:hypothetical protein [Deinococcus soli (ex Cha et al. 2016)]|uniref:ABC-type transporter Mla subunit MlaD n=2 Tax=Deinococcus soli (ex Cha et al. 2016) TaxID=1309411 RepID=A0AAE3XDP3_9DEIO|nr:hypothetical protein [Deinococcus soli (ex Cha et al. 2016)]MDR6218739.1 ABC-type transporter Mla subunit MlaD [Deinococcus soli (ex Cha et al. 2016)]MDR6328536.1 ABC-type transporter Mla subunit MlaD [Deinococcus soli (ex Cha et al. 2016)]MDR6753147.1 ABC-type transporter Mla subunit MlaD [Deinococcus soli (ex Cha et al. 2016)]
MTTHPTVPLTALFAAVREVDRAAQQLDDTPLDPQRAQAALALDSATQDLRNALSRWTPEQDAALLNLLHTTETMDVHEISRDWADLMTATNPTAS